MFLRDIEKLIRMSIPVTDHPSLTRRARQSTEQSRSTRPPDHAFGKPRHREDKPRHQHRHEQRGKAPRGLPAFLSQRGNKNSPEKS